MLFHPASGSHAGQQLQPCCRRRRRRRQRRRSPARTTPLLCGGLARPAIDLSIECARLKTRLLPLTCSVEDGAEVAPGGSGGTSFERKVRRAKRAARSELSVSRGEWRKHGYAASPTLLQAEHLVDTLPRVDAASLTPEEFAQRFELPKLPCMLTGLCEGWRAQQEWTPDRLLQRLGECKFKVGAGWWGGGRVGGWAMASVATRR